MKKTVLLVLLAGIILTNSYSQRELQSFKNEFRLNPVMLMFNEFNCNYERLFENYSLLISAGPVYKHDDIGLIKGAVGEFQFKYFLQKYPYPEKGSEKEVFYAAPFIRSKYLNYKSNGYDDTIFSFGCGLLFGLKFTSVSRISLDFNVGAMIKYADVETERIVNPYQNDLFSVGHSGVIPTGSLTFGFKF